MTDEDRNLLIEEVKSDVIPSGPFGHGVNTGCRYAVLISQIDDSCSIRTRLSNLSNALIVQLGNLASLFSFGAPLKSCRVRVEHLLTHCREFEVADVVVAAVSIDMVDRYSFWYGANKHRGNQPVHQESLSISAKIKRHALGMSGLIFSPFQWPSFLTPETSQSPHITAFIDFVPAFIARNGFPHAENYTVGGGAQ